MSKLLALLSATRYAKGTMYLLDELQCLGFATASIPIIHTTVQKDNSAALTIANIHKIRPCTRHINVAYHHFCTELAAKRMTIVPIASRNRLADFFTKAVDSNTFSCHRQLIMVW